MLEDKTKELIFPGLLNLFGLRLGIKSGSKYRCEVCIEGGNCNSRVYVWIFYCEQSFSLSLPCWVFNCYLNQSLLAAKYLIQLYDTYMEFLFSKTCLKKCGSLWKTLIFWPSSETCIGGTTLFVLFLSASVSNFFIFLCLFYIFLVAVKSNSNM